MRGTWVPWPDVGTDLAARTHGRAGGGTGAGKGLQGQSWDHIPEIPPQSERLTLTGLSFGASLGPQCPFLHTRNSSCSIPGVTWEEMKDFHSQELEMKDYF